MKKYSFVLVLSAMLCIFVLPSCSKNIDDITSLSSIHQEYDEEAYDKLKDYKKSDIKKAWGEPSEVVLGDETWYIYGDNENEYMALLYDDEKVIKVESVVEFKATILKVFENSIMVESFENEEEMRSSDKISVGISDISENTKSQLKENSEVIIKYSGGIAESYPAQIHKVYSIEICE